MFTSGLFAGGRSVRLSDPGAGWLSGLLGRSAKSAAGVTVTPELALSLTTLQACVSLLAESVAQLPLALYRRDGDQRTVVADHPAAMLLRLRPNGWMTPYEYLEGQQLSAGLRGNSYAFIERDEAARPLALIPMNPDKVVVLRGGDGLPYYRFDGSEPMPQRMVHHVRWLSLNSYTGISPVQLHSNSIGLALAMQGHASSVFANGTHLAGVLERPAVVAGEKLDSLSREQVGQIKELWRAEYSGTANAMKVAVLQDGVTFRPLSMTNADAQLIEAQGMSSLDIARAYKVPPHKVGLLDRATNNNIEHQGIEFVVFTLMPWLKRYEQAYSRDLLLPSEQGELYFEFNVGGLLRGDVQSRYESYAKARQWGWLSVNDIRRLENLPPVDGGNTYLQPLNMVSADVARVAEKVPRAEAVAEVEQALNP